MGNKIKTYIYFLKTWIIVSPIASAIYLGVWITLIFNESLFKKLDILFGFFPNILNKIYYVEADLNGADVPMGYVYAATIMIVSTLISIKIENRFVDLYNTQEERAQKAFMRRQKLALRQKPGEKKISVEPSCYFFGLFEMKFEYLNMMGKSLEDLEKLKKEYSKMLIAKLKEKYPDVQFVVSNKIFIISNEFTVFDRLLCDIIKIFAIFQKLNNDKFIGSSFLLSFDSGNEENNPKEAYRFLSKINNLSYYNQVIILEKFAKKYKYVLTKQFISVPLGLIRVELDNNREADVDLYYLETMK